MSTGAPQSPAQAGLPAICMIGLGIQGGPIAERLLRQGFGVTGWNRSAHKAAPLITGGLQLAPTAAAAAQGAPIVALCLTDEHAVEAVMFGAEGVAGVAGPATTVLDFSTMRIEAAQAMGTRLRAQCGAAWIDAPVSGGPSGARDGRLAVFLGGEAADIARVEPVLNAIARVHTHMGPLGAGQATKLCNQMVVSAALLAISEAVTMGRALGLDMARFADAVAGGYADSRPMQIFAPRMVSGHTDPRISEVATMLKDVRLVTAAIAGQPVELRLLRTVLALYEDAAARGYSAEDLAILPALSDRGIGAAGAG